MRALVVFESMFGNTEKIAAAIADGLSATMDVETVEVGSAGESVAGVDLLVVGGPTHAFAMTRESTRKSAAEQAPEGIVSKGPGLREWLSALNSADAAIATFDTKVAKPRLPGSAARGARRRLRRLGYRPVTAATTFYVTGTTGPLIAGEEERARRWGDQLSQTLAPH